MIGIDIRFMSRNMQRGKITSGTGLFCAEVLAGIVDCNRESDFKLIADSKQIDLAKQLFSQFSICEYNRLAEGRFRSVLKHIEEKRFRRFLENNNIDFIWFPFATPYHFESTGTHCLLTIHDLIPVHEEKGSDNLKNSFLRLLNSGDNIVTISEYVKQDICNTYSTIDFRRINVIPNPVSLDISKCKEIKELQTKQFILDINAFQERKNVETLICAFSESTLVESCDLVFCGGYNEDNYLEKMKALASEKGIENSVHFYLRISLEERNWLIKNAAILVSPSLAEGFGRTPVEAMIACKPVITSSLPVFIESTMGLANYYGDPKDIKSLSKSLESVYYNPTSDPILKEISRKLAEKYHPCTIAKQYLLIFDSWSTSNE